MDTAHSWLQWMTSLFEPIPSGSEEPGDCREWTDWSLDTNWRCLWAPDDQQQRGTCRSSTHGTSTRSSYNTWFISLVGNPGILHIDHIGMRGVPWVTCADLSGGDWPALHRLTSHASALHQLTSHARGGVLPNPPCWEEGSAESDVKAVSVEQPAYWPVSCCDTPFLWDWVECWGNYCNTSSAWAWEERLSCCDTPFPWEWEARLNSCCDTSFSWEWEAHLDSCCDTSFSWEWEAHLDSCYDTSFSWEWEACLDSCCDTSFSWEWEARLDSCCDTSFSLRTTRHHNIANFGYPTPQHREQTTRDDILIGTDLLGQLQSHVGERTSFSGVNPEKKTENGKPLEQQIAHCNR